MGDEGRAEFPPPLSTTTDFSSVGARRKPPSPYLEMFRRHRLMLSLPTVLAIAIAMWTGLAAPNSYEATASLWLDTPPTQPSSQTQGDSSLRSPAAQGQLILTELLGTRGFRISVGRDGPLASYFAVHPPSGKGPMDLVTGILGGSPSVDDRITSALNAKHVTSTVLGPQVLSVSLRFLSPSVAAETLSVLLKNFDSEAGGARQSHAQATLDYYRNLVDAAGTTAADTQSRLNAYQVAHPAHSADDATFSTLSQAASAAAAAANEAKASSNRAAVEATSTSTVATFRVIDAPVSPKGPTGGRKRTILVLILAGMFAGALTGFLGLMALVSMAGSGASTRNEPVATEATDARGHDDRDLDPAGFRARSTPAVDAPVGIPEQRDLAAERTATLRDREQRLRSIEDTEVAALD